MQFKAIIMETIQSKRKLGQGQDRLDDNILFDVLDNDEEDASDVTESEASDSSDLEDEEPDTSSDDSSQEEEEEESESSNDADSEEKDSDESEDDDTDEDVEHVKTRLPDQDAKETRAVKSAGLLRKKKTQREIKDEGEKTDITEKPVSSSDTRTATVPDEYEYDSSDEEDLRNTVGNIPMEWYKEYAHIGYDLLGDKILKGKSADELDEFLSKMDDPNYWRTVKDKSTGQKVILSDKDVTLVDRFKSGKYVDPNYNPYEPWIDFFTCDKMIHPVSNRPEHKRSFIPSKWEKLKVGKIVHAMKMGWIKPKPPKSADDDEVKFYNLWRNDDQAEMSKRLRQHIPAPKMQLPGHEESYNPPPEYLLTEAEELAWKDREPEERKLNFLPKKYSCLRQVPAFPRFINERFERCLDLYLCPRQRKMRMNVNPDDLIPKLPKPKELQPFPTTQSMVYRGHISLVRCISVEPGGQWLVSGCDDKTIKFWEVQTGRCMKTLTVQDVVKDIAWNPNSSLCLVAAAVGQDIIVINPMLGDKLVISNTDNMIESYLESDEQTSQSKVATEWQAFQGQKHEDGFRLTIKHTKAVSQVCWHGRGDYCAVVIPQGGNSSVLIHQLSKRRSQNPFRKSKGLVQSVLFHPTRPFLFVATQRYVRIYNLLKQALSKKLLTNMKWVSSLAVHPAGDNCIIGSYDCKLSWFDLDLSTKPYQTLRHHKKAIRQVCYHKRYPLFASASDDGSIIVCHGMVYSDMLKNPLIVPVKVLRGHERTRDLGVLDCEFHPTQPWLFSSGSDHTIRLFT